MKSKEGHFHAGGSVNICAAGEQEGFGGFLRSGDVLQPTWAPKNPDSTVYSCKFPLPITHTANAARSRAHGQPCKESIAGSELQPGPWQHATEMVSLVQGHRPLMSQNILYQRILALQACTATGQMVTGDSSGMKAAPPCSSPSLFPLLPGKEGAD